ncbi:hypothetical protein LINPERHAP1_LOCUS30986, partial [Linum perenne]
MRCFLPTNLHELAMHQGLTAHQAFQEYEFTFLSTAFGCGQVFIPMKDNDEHWYLVVILMKDKMVYVGDSCPNYTNREIQ